MIIYEDGAFVTDNDYPDTDFSGGNAKYVIPDGSELAAKVFAYFPNYKIIEDGSGGIADVAKVEGVEPAPELTIEDLAAAIAELAEVVANG